MVEGWEGERVSQYRSKGVRVSVKVDEVVSVRGFVGLCGSKEEKEFDQTRCPSFDSPQAVGMSNPDVEEEAEKEGW